MLHENLVLLRKQKGLTQEAVAEHLHVVRQTVSKWEKGLSVPDADALRRLAELYDVPVSRLLGPPQEEEPLPDRVAEQLAAINEQLAIRNRRSRRIWKSIGTTLLLIFLAYLIMAVLLTARIDSRRTHTADATETGMWSEADTEE